MTQEISQKISPTAFASQQLEAGKVYTRDDLRNLFHITASSLNTGIFKPANLNSVWLFVTEHKTPDRTQYEDLLDGDVLYMDGQLKGMTDKLIKEHSERGLELIVFYRKKKYEHPGAGFRFEGRFLYQSHKGSGPTQFILHREPPQLPTIASIEAELEFQETFDPTNVVDARKRTLATIVRRQGQSAFRKKLLNAYSSQCAVTGCNVEALLEAAHIAPYMGEQTNVVSNGLLLRADIHTLFDLGLLWVDPDTFQLSLKVELKHSEYASLADTVIRLPDLLVDRPSVEALRSRWQLRKSL